MTADEHMKRAEECIDHAEQAQFVDHMTAWATMASAHAAIATALLIEGTR